MRGGWSARRGLRGSCAKQAVVDFLCCCNSAGVHSCCPLLSLTCREGNAQFLPENSNVRSDLRSAPSASAKKTQVWWIVRLSNLYAHTHTHTHTPPHTHTHTTTHTPHTHHTTTHPHTTHTHHTHTHNTHTHTQTRTRTHTHTHTHVPVWNVIKPEMSKNAKNNIKMLWPSFTDRS